MAQLGRAVTILLREAERCDYEYQDLAAFHAPSECYGVVERGQARRFRLVRRHACHVAGVKNVRLLRKALKRACPSWDRLNHYRFGIQFTHPH